MKVCKYSIFVIDFYIFILWFHNFIFGWYIKISCIVINYLLILKYEKGCRGAQCGWMQLDESSLRKRGDPNQDINLSFNAEPERVSYEKEKKTTFSLPWTVKNTLLLLIYIAPRGILEIYHLGIKHRLGALLFNPNGKLLYHLSLFHQTKSKKNNSNSTGPSHIYLCDYFNKNEEKSTFSLKSFKTASVDDIDLDNFDEEDLKNDSTMYELKINIIQSNDENNKNNNTNTKNGLLSPPNPLSATQSTASNSSLGRYCPITFIPPLSTSNLS